MITNNFENFAISLIEQVPFDISNLELDHFGYQTSSAQNYDDLKQECRVFGDLISENVVGGRRVGIFKFIEPFRYDNFEVSGFELVEPKEGQVCESELDHLEFVIPVSFEDYLEEHRNDKWDLSSMERKEFPKIVLKLENGKSVKFHTKNIFEEIPD